MGMWGPPRCCKRTAARQIITQWAGFLLLGILALLPSARSNEAGTSRREVTTRSEQEARVGNYI